MIIFNKRKHFEKVSCDLLNMARNDVSRLNVVLTSIGLKSHIEADKDKFVIVTWLHLLFFQEICLRKKYNEKYNNEVDISIDYMIDRIAERFNYKAEKLTDVYLVFRKQLDNLSDDKICAEVGLFYAVAFHYLHNFLGEYDFEEFGIYDDRVEYTLANFFQQSMQDNLNYLSIT